MLLLVIIFGLCAPSLGVPSSQTYLRHQSDVKVVGGYEAYKGQFPYQVSFQEKILGTYYHFCGGVIIDPEFVITAAHCVDGADYTSPRGLRVVAGEHDLDVDDGDEQFVEINFIIQHPFYDRITFENDIAILRMEQPLNFTELIGPLILPEPGQNFTSEVCVVSGWGTTAEGGATPSVLHFTDLPAVSDEHCREGYTHDEIMDSMLCAGYDEGHQGACKGDSGGPLTCGSYFAGVVSWAFGCARPGLPGVYTEVSYFVDWIQSHI